MCLVGLGVCENAFFKISSCLALMVVLGPLRLLPPLPSSNSGQPPGPTALRFFSSETCKGKVFSYVHFFLPFEQLRGDGTQSVVDHRREESSYQLGDRDNGQSFAAEGEGEETTTAIDGNGVRLTSFGIIVVFPVAARPLVRSASA